MLGKQLSFGIDASDVQDGGAKTNVEPKSLCLQRSYLRSLAANGMTEDSRCSIHHNHTDSEQNCNKTCNRKQSLVCAAGAGTIPKAERQCSTTNGPCTSFSTKTERQYSTTSGTCTSFDQKTERQCSTTSGTCTSFVLKTSFQVGPGDLVSEFVEQPATRQKMSDIVSNSFIATKSFLIPPVVQEATIRWLRFLFFATLALLAFQVLLGWIARVVTLIADSGHTATDAIGYGLNWLAEWFKLRSKRDSMNTASSNIDADNILADTVGSVFSLLLLTLAIWFTIVEATDRLHMPSGEHSECIGSALMSFAIVSTVMNLGLLLLYRAWQLEAPLAQENQNANKTELKDAIGESFDEYVKSLEICPPCTSSDIGFASNSISRTLVDAMNDESLAENGRAMERSNSSVKGVASTQTEGLSANSEESSNYIQTLHMWVHPGCQCRGLDESVKQKTIAKLEGRDVTTPQDASLSKMKENLNLFSALLHLITDLLRSILILGASILIQFIGDEHAEQIDAICALLVAFLIFVGSFALFLKLSARVCQQQRTGRLTSTQGNQVYQLDRATPLL
jgi:Co/Zn/Cd efflux system component